VSITAPVSSRAEIARAHFALAGAQVAFGLFPVLGHLVFRPGGISPLAVGAWRLTGGAAILLPMALAAYRKAALPARADLPRLAIASGLGVGLNQGLYLEGLARSTPMNAVLVMCLIPIFTFGLAAAVRLESFSPARLAGVLIALAGTLPLLVARGFSGLGPYGLGNLLMVANSLSYSSYLIVSKPLLRRYPPLVVIAWSYALSLAFVPFFAWGQRLLPEPGHAAAWWSLAYIVLFPTVLAYLLNMYALVRLPASTTAIYIYAQPFITGVASWAAFGEVPTLPMLIGALALFVGVWLVSRRFGPTLEPGRA
jgi:drug/metabolite transporter (DMT)-like permease